MIFSHPGHYLSRIGQFPKTTLQLWKRLRQTGWIGDRDTVNYFTVELLDFREVSSLKVFGSWSVKRISA